MGKFSTYRYLELKDDTTAHINVRSRGIKQPRKLKKVFFLLIVAVLFATYFMGLFAGQAQWLDGIAKTLGYQSDYHYAVIIDAGSSGSRVLAYKFRVPFAVFGQPSLDLEEEFFEQSKPGLSSFPDNPDKGAETIVELIKKAEYMIPVDKRHVTPLIVRATAGLRLLPQEKASQLLKSVTKAVGKLGYDVSAGVEIMDGSDEGIFIWYTVNLLHNLIEGETMAALDLGGGSTQITYQLEDKDTGSYPSKDKFVVPAPNNVTLYTHSYLGLGLLAARFGIFLSESDDNSSNEMTSVCVEPIVQNEPWTYANKQYKISGASRPGGMKREAVYERCHAAVKQYITKTLDWEPKHPPRGNVAAMSYFYDVAADAGLIDVMKGGTVSVSAYRAAGVHACSANNVEQPWACADLVYVASLLHDAYRIPLQDPVFLFKKVNGHEVSWALGLAYTTVMNRLAAATAAA